VRGGCPHQLADPAGWLVKRLARPARDLTALEGLPLTTTWCRVAARLGHVCGGHHLPSQEWILAEVIG